MLTVFAAVAQFERERIKERQAEGIKRAKENGVYKGGKPRIDRSEVARLKDEGLNPTQIAAEARHQPRDRLPAHGGTGRQSGLTTNRTVRKGRPARRPFCLPTPRLGRAGRAEAVGELREIGWLRVSAASGPRLRLKEGRLTPRDLLPINLN